jgi:hypothetical protein
LGLLAGAAFIWIYAPTRRVALGLIHTLQEIEGVPQSSV